MTQKKTGPYATVQAPEYPTPKQMKEFYALVDAGKITRTTMQQVLRPKPRIEIIPDTPVHPVAEKYAKALTEIEAVCRSVHPEIVSEVLELVVPFCHPAVDFELAPLRKPHETGETARKALFWRATNRCVFHSARPTFFSRADHYQLPTERSLIGEEVYNLPLTNETSTHKMLNSGFGRGAGVITASFTSMVLGNRLVSTKAVYYQAFGTNGMERWVENSIRYAFEKAVAFLAVGDKERGMAFQPFLEIQRSGTPIIFYAPGKREIHLLCAPGGEPETVI